MKIILVQYLRTLFEHFILKSVNTFHYYLINCKNSTLSFLGVDKKLDLSHILFGQGLWNFHIDNVIISIFSPVVNSDIKYSLSY